VSIEKLSVALNVVKQKKAALDAAEGNAA